MSNITLLCYRSGTVAPDLSVDRDSEVPLGTQLAWKLRTAIATGLLQPGEIQTVEIKTPSNPAMARSMLQFSHANGTVPKPHPVTKFDDPGKESATKSASSTKKAAPKK